MDDVGRLSDVSVSDVRRTSVARLTDVHQTSVERLTDVCPSCVRRPSIVDANFLFCGGLGGGAAQPSLRGSGAEKPPSGNLFTHTNLRVRIHTYEFMRQTSVICFRVEV